MLTLAIAPTLCQYCQKIVNYFGSSNPCQHSSLKGSTPLYWAATNGHAEVVKLLLDAEADPDKADVEGETPLYWAAVKDHRDVVKMLLDAGADPDKANKVDEKTPLYQAAENGLKETVELLLNAGANPNKYDEEGITPLNRAVQNFHWEVAMLLIKRRAKVDMEDKLGMAEMISLR